MDIEIKEKLEKKFEEIWNCEAGDTYMPRVTNARDIICQGKYDSDEMIEIFDTSISKKGKTGLVLTIDSVCVKDSANSDSKFIAKYRDIRRTEIVKESLLFGMKMVSLELRMRDHTTLKINLESINLGRLKDFIDYARSLYR